MKRVGDPVIRNRQRQEPWRAEIERPRLEREGVENGLALGRTQYLERRLVAQPRRTSDSNAAVAHRVVQAIDLADMRQFVEREGEHSVPGMRQLGVAQLWKHLRQRAVQMPGIPPVCLLSATRKSTAAEDDARTIGRWPVITHNAQASRKKPLFR